MAKSIYKEIFAEYPFDIKFGIRLSTVKLWYEINVKLPEWIDSQEWETFVDYPDGNMWDIHH